MTHFGDPCIHCATPHDDVASGPCPGDPAKAIVIGYALVEHRYDGMELYRFRTSDNVVRERWAHPSEHAPYWHFGRKDEFGQPPPYDERLKAAPPPPVMGGSSPQNPQVKP